MRQSSFSSSPFLSASPNADIFDIIEVFNQDGISVLLGCLKDSYEHNKMMAYDLLKAVPPHCLPFQVCRHVDRYLLLLPVVVKQRSKIYVLFAW